MLIISGILLVASFVAVLIYTVALKLDIRQLGDKLNDISKTETNAQLATMTFDKDVTALADSINALLAQHKLTISAKDNAEAGLRRAITNISHDLRTPLTSAIGYLQLIKTESTDAEARARYIETAEGRLNSLSALMNSLFEFTRITEGYVQFEIQKINICNILRDALSACYAELTERGFDVDVHVPEAPVYCLCDETAVRRVLQNIILNVYTHGVRGMKAEINTFGNIVEIKVANHLRDAKNIDPSRLFDRFYTSDASRTHKNTGLGLAIAKELVTRMDGGISATMEDDMLAMRVTLPLQMQPPAQLGTHGPALKNKKGAQ